jgi:hypothetical protein
MNLFRPHCIQLLFWIIVWFFTGALRAEDGYQLWLRYDEISQPELVSDYREHITEIVIQESSPTFQAVQEELRKGLSGLLGKEIPVVSSFALGLSSGIRNDFVGRVKISLPKRCRLRYINAERMGLARG